MSFQSDDDTALMGVVHWLVGGVIVAVVIFSALMLLVIAVNSDDQQINDPNGYAVYRSSDWRVDPR